MKPEYLHVILPVVLTNKILRFFSVSTQPSESRSHFTVHNGYIYYRVRRNQPSFFVHLKYSES
jgi:hypothetical protein